MARRNRQVYQRWNLIKYKYGITKEQWMGMFAAQQGRCGICERLLNIDGGRANDSPCVDHCHATGRIRGLLCGVCNRLLGQLETRVGFVSKAQRYLGRVL